MYFYSSLKAAGLEDFSELFWDNSCTRWETGAILYVGTSLPNTFYLLKMLSALQHTFFWHLCEEADSCSCVRLSLYTLFQSMVHTSAVSTCCFCCDSGMTPVAHSYGLDGSEGLCALLCQMKLLLLFLTLIFLYLNYNIKCLNIKFLNTYLCPVSVHNYMS